jgi:KDO2-lipid IV(A) lauroyltransferase
MSAIVLYKTGSYLARVLPPKIKDAITWTIAQLSIPLLVRPRRNVEKNLQIVHGGSLSKRELRRKSRRVITNFARTIHIFLNLPWYRWDELRSRVDLSDLETAVASLGPRPTFLLASIHMGPWELGGLCLSKMGFKVNTVALDHGSERVTRFFDNRRRCIGMVNHPMRKSYSILKDALARGECVALLVDRAYGATHKKFKFFGRDVQFPLGHLFLSASTGAPILTGALVFTEEGSYRYVHGGIHYPPKDGKEDMDKLEGLQAQCLRDFERIIHEYSDQWFLFDPMAIAE